MKDILIKALKTMLAVIWLAMIAPFIIPAFGIVKLIGGDPFSMDGMGADFVIMCVIAGGLVLATGAFALGYFL